MSDGYLGEIRLFGGNFAPDNWAFCDGTLVPIAQNTALFSILGTTYGGNGSTTFALPDLRGRAAMHPGQGPGLSNHSLGEFAGSERYALHVFEIPAHNHRLRASKLASSSTSPKNAVYAVGGAYAPSSDGTTMKDDVIANEGAGEGHENMQPFLVANYIICIEGLFPSRD
jgi:microcystin-dependent protein